MRLKCNLRKERGVVKIRLRKKNYLVWYVLVISLAVLLGLSSAGAINRNLSVFYANISEIGYMSPQNPRSISWTVHDSPDYAGETYWAIKQYARNQWTSAGFSTTLTQPSQSNIHIVFGYDDDLQEEYRRFRDLRAAGMVFIADVVDVRDGSVTYQGTNIPLYRHNSAIIWFPRISAAWPFGFWHRNHYRHAMLHELGHVFGWCGHSPNSSDVMRSSWKGPTTLTNRDIMHIYQIIGP